MSDMIAGVTILVDDRHAANQEMNAILSKYGRIIVGRMGVPHLANDRSVVTLILQGDADAIDSLVCELTAVEETRGFRTVLARFES